MENNQMKRKSNVSLEASIQNKKPRLIRGVNERRLCLKNVPSAMTKDQIEKIFFQDFEGVSIYSP